MHRLSLAAGQTLYRQGEASHLAYLILRGRIEMTRGPVVTPAGEGDVVGFSGLFDRPYGATAVAASDCSLLVFSRRELKALIRSNPVEADSIIEGILAVLGNVAAALEAHVDGLFPEATAAGTPDSSNNS